MALFFCCDCVPIASRQYDDLERHCPVHTIWLRVYLKVPNQIFRISPWESRKNNYLGLWEVKPRPQRSLQNS